MTGGQMAPTTLLGQKSTTSPFGRDFQRDGYPIKMAEMLATLEGVCFSGRFAVDKISNLRKAKKAVLKAFEMQIKGIGFSFVEILSSCPTNWGLSPIEANKRIEDEMIPYYPLGIFKEKTTKDEL
jgi:2-oxoglutarate ferredoxin oxidoreductase subunit beta